MLRSRKRPKQQERHNGIHQCEEDEYCPFFSELQKLPADRIVLQSATSRGVIILSVTQCVSGGVSGIYETGKALLDAGVIPGGDITPEVNTFKGGV